MRFSRAGVLVGTAACVALMSALLWAAEPTAEDRARATDEMVVTAKAIADLRVRIELAENEVYARFNEINSNDHYDIHCYEGPQVGSHIKRRTCMSNAWREADEATGQAMVRSLQTAPVVGSDGTTSNSQGGVGEAGAIPQKYRANQLRTETLVQKELSRLAHEDPDLRAAMIRVGQARLALEAVTGSKSDWTLYHDVPAGADGLPFGAQRAVEVRVGEVAWNHTLTSRTFTIAGVHGRVRDLHLKCVHHDSKLAYKEDVDWTVPAEWGACTLRVDAKRDTTFALYEFE